MAAAASGLIYVFDENFGRMMDLLRGARAPSHGSMKSLSDLGIPAGALDPALLSTLGQHGGCVLLTRDGSMLNPVVQRGAWKSAGVTLFLLGGAWGQLALGELARRFLFLWPHIVRHAENSSPGAAWRVSPGIPGAGANAFRLVTGKHAE